MFELIREIKKMNDARKRFMSTVFIKIVESNDDYTMIFNEDLLISKGYVLAGSYRMPINNKMTDVICIGKDFNDAPKYVQDFVISHELAHLKSMDYIKTSKNELVNLFDRIILDHITLENEFEADRVATDMVGIDNSIASLCWIEDKYDISLKRRKNNILKRRA